jgi:hypothetical protein
VLTAMVWSLSGSQESHSPDMTSDALVQEVECKGAVEDEH